MNTRCRQHTVIKSIYRTKTAEEVHTNCQTLSTKDQKLRIPR